MLQNNKFSLLTQFTCFLFLSLLSSLGWSQVFITQAPKSHQLFQRDNSDSARIILAGYITGSVKDSAKLEIFKNGQIIAKHAMVLDYRKDTAHFNFQASIHAELSEYRIQLIAGNESVLTADSVVCGEVFVIAGQSNGRSSVPTNPLTRQSQYVRTFGSNYTASMDTLTFAADTVWGPAHAGVLKTIEDRHLFAGTWPLQMALMLMDSFHVPIGILNGCLGDTEIRSHLRHAKTPFALSTIYGRLLYRAEKAGIRSNVKGWFWYQGENDCGDTACTYTKPDVYLSRFDSLYRSWKLDYPAIRKIYVVQVRNGFTIREAQRSLGDRYNDLEVMASAGLPGYDGPHYDTDGYLTLADWLFHPVARDYFQTADTLHIGAPRLLSAAYANPEKSRIILHFTQPVLWPQDTLIQDSIHASLKDYFFPDSLVAPGLIDSGFTDNDNTSITLKLKSPASTGFITYLPGMHYFNSNFVKYQGPWLRSKRGVGVPAFYKIPVSSYTNKEAARTGSSKPKKELRIPNPFRPNSILSYISSTPIQTIRITLLNSAGARFRSYNITPQPNTHIHHLTWDGLDSSGKPVSPGVYFIHLKTNVDELSGKIILMQ